MADATTKDQQDQETLTLADAALRSNANNSNIGIERGWEKPEDVFSERAQYRADQIGLIRTRLASSTDGYLDRAGGVLLAHRDSLDKRLPDEAFKRYVTSVRHATEQLELDQRLEHLEREFRSRVTIKEVDPYAEGSPHSFVRDRLAASDQQDALGLQRGVDNGYSERLQRHASIVGRAVDRNDEYGQKIRAQIEAQHRPQVNDPGHPEVVGARKMVADELRALTTGGGAVVSASGGGAAAFIWPDFLLSKWAVYRSPFASFVSQLDDSVPLASWGMQAYVPIVTGGTSVAEVTEGDALAEQDPTITFASGAVEQFAGKVTASQAVLDRFAPNIGGDVMILQQLKNQLDAQTDVYAINEALANAQAVTNSGTFALATTTGVGGFLGDVKKAKSLLTDTAGTRLRGTHLFAVDDFGDFIGSYADAQGRPVFSPSFDDNRLPVKSVGDPAAEGYSGYVLNGLALFGDSNIPASGSDIQVIVTRADTISYLAGPAVPYVYPAGGVAGNLEAYVAVSQYVACVPRYPSGVAVISGAAYAASTFNAS